MTANKYLTYWCSNDNWWDYDENGIPVVLDTDHKKQKTVINVTLNTKRNTADVLDKRK